MNKIKHNDSRRRVNVKPSILRKRTLPSTANFLWFKSFTRQKGSPASKELSLELSWD